MRTAQNRREPPKTAAESVVIRRLGNTDHRTTAENAYWSRWARMAAALREPLVPLRAFGVWGLAALQRRKPITWARCAGDIRPGLVVVISFSSSRRSIQL